MPMSERLKNFLSFLNGFRKFTVMSILVIVAMVFRILGYINGAEMVDLLKDVAVAYMAFNGLEHMTSAVKEWVKGKVKKESK